MSLLWLTFWLLQQVNIFHSLTSSSHHALKLFLCLSSHFSLALFAWSSNREFRTQDLFNLLIQKKQISSADKIPGPKPLVNKYIGNYLTEPSCREAAREIILSSSGDRFKKSTSMDKESHPIQSSFTWVPQGRARAV
jgi:hypothetical protein